MNEYELIRKIASKFPRTSDVDAGLFGLFDILGQVARQAPANVLHVMQDGSQRIVDFVSHAGSQATNGQHFF